MVVDGEDDLKVPWQKRPQDVKWPYFQGFRKECVAGVVEGLLGDVPCVIPAQAVLIEEKSHELRNGDDGVWVVELDGDGIRESVERASGLEVSGEQVMEGRCREEVLLGQTKCASLGSGIFGIEDV